MDDPGVMMKLAWYVVVSLALFGVVLWVGAVLDRKDKVAALYGWWGRLRCASCPKSYRCVRMCQKIRNEGRPLL